MSILQEIMNSKVRTAFFKILFGLDSKEYHLREIQRRSGFAIDTVRKEAAKLEQLDLIIKRVDGNRNYYSSNKKHQLYPGIHEIVLKTVGLGDVLKSSLNDISILFAFVFGSIAEGKEKVESDIDLFVISDIGLRKLSSLLSEAARILDREVNPYVISREEFIKRKKEGNHFIKNVVNSTKIMIIGDENEFDRLG
jgi:predicted nucleotidyltransferase